MVAKTVQLIFIVFFSKNRNLIRKSNHGRLTSLLLQLNKNVILFQSGKVQASLNSLSFAVMMLELSCGISLSVCESLFVLGGRVGGSNGDEEMELAGLSPRSGVFC